MSEVYQKALITSSIFFCSPFLKRVSMLTIMFWTCSNMGNYILPTTISPCHFKWMQCSFFTVLNYCYVAAAIFHWGDVSISTFTSVIVEDGSIFSLTQSSLWGNITARNECKGGNGLWSEQSWDFDTIRTTVMLLSPLQASFHSQYTKPNSQNIIIKAGNTKTHKSNTASI